MDGQFKTNFMQNDSVDPIFHPELFNLKTKIIFLIHTIYQQLYKNMFSVSLPNQNIKRFDQMDTLKPLTLLRG